MKPACYNVHCSQERLAAGRENLAVSRVQPTTAMGSLELPGVVVADRLDGPVELVTERLGEELLDGNLELVGEDDGEAGVDVVLAVNVSSGKVHKS